jgi:hypothetical protein
LTNGVGGWAPGNPYDDPQRIAIRRGIAVANASMYSRHEPLKLLRNSR